HTLAISAKLHEFSEAVYAGPRYIDAGRTRWLQHLLSEAQTAAADIKNPRIDQQLARIVAHAKRRKFFWAEADTRQLLEQLPPPPVTRRARFGNLLRAGRRPTRTR